MRSVRQPIQLESLLALIAIIVVTGCARFEQRPISVEQAAADFASRTLEEVGLRAFMETNRQEALRDWPLSKWDFPDLTLAAWYYNPDLDVARARAATMEASRITAGERPNPTLSATPGYNTTQSVPTPWFVAASLDIPVETAGKRGYRIAQAEHLSEAARQNLATVAWQVRSRLRRSLVELSASKETERQLEQQVATLEQIVRLHEAQLHAGERSSYEVNQSRVALERTRMILYDSQRRRQEALAQVAATVGLPVTALPEDAISFDSLYVDAR